MSSAETVVRNYHDWLLDPVEQEGEGRRISSTRRRSSTTPLWPREGQGRIVEYLAVQQRANKLTGPILCLVGRPASARPRGKSIARATGRDRACRSAACATRPRSAAIAAPISARCPAGDPVDAQGEVVEPLFLLDEVDKMSSDFSDPSSALLEC
jgi:ATP-dependent Lon protease